MIVCDLAHDTVRSLNSRLHKLPQDTNERVWRIANPKGAHALVTDLLSIAGINAVGGGLLSLGTLVAVNSTFSGNSAPVTEGPRVPGNPTTSVLVQFSDLAVGTQRGAQ